MQLVLDNHTIPITAVEDLHLQFEQVRQQQFSEVWLDTGDEGPILAMLINGNHAWLMYLRDHDGDPGFSSRNAHYTGSAEATMEFLLSNGQMDEYPAAWTIPLVDAFEACEFFFLNQGGRSPVIVWHNDSIS